jgi:hypothetical protein
MKTRTFLTRALGALCALSVMFLAATAGANPAESLAKDRIGTTGGIDPHGDSWQSIQNSFQQFENPAFVLRLFLSLTLAAACACTIAWRPRRLMGAVPQLDFEERKTLIILGVVGAIIAELSGTSATLAFVIFGVGALLRFRTVLDNPKASGKAILSVVIGLACGMGSWTMAVFVTAFSWVLLLVLDSKVTCNMTIGFEDDEDPKQLRNTVQALLLSHQCQFQSCKLSKDKDRMKFTFNMPAKLDPDQLEADVREELPKKGDSKISIELV